MTSVKKNLTTVGYITINNKHPFSQGANGFQISPKMQERMVYCAQLDSYESCQVILEKFTDVKVSSTQVWRVANVYGEAVGKTLNEEVNLTPCKKDEVVYAMADGSMVFTREEGWKEVKVGRVFKSSDCIHAEEKAGWISNSQYLAHLGGHAQFISQMEKLLDYYTERRQPIVFISDGAPWIKNWIEDAYPNAVTILDFYHASEYLHSFCKAARSGAIESAHRVIVQKRLKQSGQRWSKKGAQNMLNLRVVNKNNQWGKIVALAKQHILSKTA